MKAVEGISLKSIADDIEKEIVAEKRHEVSKQIRGIYQDIHNWNKQLEDAKRSQAKLESKITKAKAKLEQIGQENWSVLGDNNSQGDKKSKEETEDDI